MSQGYRGGQFLSNPTFRTGTQHFEKHGAEMGISNSSQYIQAAQNLMRGGPNTQSFVRQNGDTLVYNLRTNEFGVLDRANNIRTYFKPDRGYAYWLEQIGKK